MHCKPGKKNLHTSLIFTDSNFLKTFKFHRTMKKSPKDESMKIVIFKRKNTKENYIIGPHKGCELLRREYLGRSWPRTKCDSFPYVPNHY